MTFLLQTFLAYLLVYKYLALFVITLVASTVLPIPSAAPLMASSALASQGYFKITFVILTAIAGNVIGDNVGYWISRRYGAPVLYKIGFRKVIDSELFRAVEKHINRRPGIIVFFSRFEVIATLSVNIISGLGKMPYKRYLFYEVLGETVQVFMYGGIGYYFGSNWLIINDLIGQFSYLVTVVTAFAIFFFWKKIIRWIIES